VLKDAGSIPATSTDDKCPCRPAAGHFVISRGCGGQAGM
jgi:hypothetical protein